MADWFKDKIEVYDCVDEDFFIDQAIKTGNGGTLKKVYIEVKDDEVVIKDPEDSEKPTTLPRVQIENEGE